MGFLSGEYRGLYTDVLIFDTALEAFSRYKIATATELDEYPLFVAGGVMSGPKATILSPEDITVDGEEVEVDSEQVVVTRYEFDESGYDHILLTFDGASSYSEELGIGNGVRRLGWSKYGNDIDWADFSGWSQSAEETAYLETGAEIEGDVLSRKQVVYLASVFNRTELTYTVDGNPTPTVDWNDKSGCTLRAKWDWDAAGNGKWSQTENAYRLMENYLFDDSEDGMFDYDGGQRIVLTKQKLRGRGWALQLRYEADAGKDTQLLGWQLVGEGTTNA